MEWTDIRANLEEIDDLITDLSTGRSYADDLIADLWTILFQAPSPVQRDRVEVAPTRWVNHQIVALLLTCPQFIALRKTTVGDAFAAARALTGQFHRLDDLLWAATAAQQGADDAERALGAAARAAEQVVEAVWGAADAADNHGHLPPAAVSAVTAAVDAAENADALATAAVSTAEDALEQAAQDDLTQRVVVFVAGAVDRLKGERQLLDAWGIGYDQLRRMGLAERAALAERLRGHRLASFADLIGRFRAFAHAEAAQKITGGHGELVGTTHSDDIARAVPSELASLGVPALRAVFLARLAEGRLLSYQTRGQERVGRGPLIICLDASGSMLDTISGDHTGTSADPTREAWTKAVALALLDHASNAMPPRDVTVVRFSSNIDSTHHFPTDRRPTPDEVLALAEAWRAEGGTNYLPPLEAAIDLIGDSRHDPRRGADVVFLTDGEHYGDLSWLKSFQARKTRLGFRVFGVAIATRPSSALKGISDTVHTINDLTDPSSARALFRL